MGGVFDYLHKYDLLNLLRKCNREGAVPLRPCQCGANPTTRARPPRNRHVFLPKSITTCLSLVLPLPSVFLTRHWVRRSEISALLC
jgi:hypothetical protein